MERPNDQTLQIEVKGAAFEVARAGVPAAGTSAVIATSHPADAFGVPTAALLAKASGVPVVCINPRGLGKSTPPEITETYRLEDMVDDIEAVRQHLGIAAWVFWGMSGGGWLGQIYARKYPRAIRGLILESICPCFRVRLGDPACLISPLHPAWRPALEERGLIAADSHADPENRAGGSRQAAEWIEVPGVGSVWRQVAGPARLVSPAPVSPEMRAVMPQLWAFDARAWLGQIDTPTLVICGTDDPIVPMAHAVALKDRIVGADLLSVPGAGHVPVSQGRTEVEGAVRAFLRDRVR